MHNQLAIEQLAIKKQKNKNFADLASLREIFENVRKEI